MIHAYLPPTTKKTVVIKENILKRKEIAAPPERPQRGKLCKATLPSVERVHSIFRSALRVCFTRLVTSHSYAAQSTNNRARHIFERQFHSTFIPPLTILSLSISATRYLLPLAIEASVEGLSGTVPRPLVRDAIGTREERSVSTLDPERTTRHHAFFSHEKTLSYFSQGLGEVFTHF